MTEWNWRKNSIGLLWFIPLVAMFVSPLLAFKFALATSGFFWLRKWLGFGKRVGDDLVSEIQYDLNLDFAYFSYKPNNSKVVFGGYMIPFLPFFSKVRSKKSFEEAAIHEHFHLYWMIYGFQTAFVYLLMYLIGNEGWTIYIGVFCWLMIQEYLAFTSTEQYAKAIGITTPIRSFDKNTIVKYIMFYGSMLTSFGLLKIYLKPIVSVWIYLLALIAVLIILSKLWYIIWKKIGLIKGEVV